MTTVPSAIPPTITTVALPIGAALLIATRASVTSLLWWRVLFKALILLFYIAKKIFA